MMLLQIPPPSPPGPPGGFTHGPMAQCIACVPIDGGAIAVVVIGLIIGVYHLVKEQKNE